MLYSKTEESPIDTSPIATSRVVLTIAGMVAGVLSLALLGSMVDSAAELVRLLHGPRTPMALAEPPKADASSADGMGAVDASVQPVPSVVEDVRLSVVPIFEKVERSISPTGDAEGPDAGAADANEERDVAATDAMADVADAAPAPPRTDTKDAAAAAAAKLAATARPRAARCGWLTCPEGQICCNWNCAICVNPGETCSPACGAPASPISAMCGPNTCNVGEMCCNESCGTCVPLGGSCSKEPCKSVYIPLSEPCGMRTCNVGEVCCNPSCGICTLPGETCSQAPCL